MSHHHEPVSRPLPMSEKLDMCLKHRERNDSKCVPSWASGTPQPPSSEAGWRALNMKHKVLQDQDFSQDGLGGVVGECEVLV